MITAEILFFKVNYGKKNKYPRVGFRDFLFYYVRNFDYVSYCFDEY